MRIRSVVLLVTPLALVAPLSPVIAQSDPGSIERTVPRFEPPVARVPSGVVAPVVPPPSQGNIAGQFVLGAVNIVGATVFTSEELAATYEVYLASRIGQAELDRIVAEITRKYRQRGYLLSFAVLPEQSVASGIVRIRVVEGFIDEVRFEGDTRSGAAARPVSEPLENDRPLRAATLERAIGLLRDLPGIAVSDVRIARAPDDPQRHQLTIALAPDRVRVLNYLDNRGTVDGARLRGYSSFSLASALLPADQLQLDLFAIPSDRFRFLYGQGKVAVPIGSDGLRLTTSAAFADQLQRLDGPDQKGGSRQFVVDLGYPFLKSRAVTLVGHASISDWKSSERRDGSTIQRDRMQVVRAWLDYARVAQTRIDGRIGISGGMDLWSATERDDPLASRPNASGKFIKWNADLQITRPLTDRLYLRADASAQIASRPLLAPEEFALGGSRLGRAFDFNEITGDHGFGSMLEFGYRVGDLRGGPKALELFGYVDGGATFRRHESPGLPDSQWLAGTGIGTRFSLFGLNWSGELGVPLKRSDKDRSPRAFIAITKAY